MENTIIKTRKRYSSEHPIYRKRKSYQEYITDIGLLRAYDWARDFCKNATVLEIGCGDLGGGELLLREAKIDKYYAIDYNIEALYSAKKRDTAATLICASGNEIPLKNSKFDIVLTFQVIEHIVEYERFMTEIHRLIKPNGILLISTPDSPSRKSNNPYHVSFFDKLALEILLNKYFEEVKMSYHYGADHSILKGLTSSGINMPEEYIQAVNIGYKIGQISRKNRIVNWMIGSGRKGRVFKYLPLSIVNNIFKAFTGHDYHWLQFKHIPLISNYPFHCLSFFCICKDSKPLITKY